MQDWEDLIYEDRNKLYGSYYLRKKLIKYLTIGLLTSIVMCGTPLLFFYFQYQNQLNDLDMPMSIPTELSNPAVLEKLMEPPPEPIEKVDHNQSEATPVVSDSIAKPIIKMAEKVNSPKPVENLPVAEKPKPDEGNGSTGDKDNKMIIKADQMPQYIGGQEELIKFIRQHTVYPANAAKQKIQGQVMVGLLVSETGEVKNIRILSGVNSELDQEALRVVRIMPRWIPAKKGGKSVSINYSIPIVFKL